MFFEFSATHSSGFRHRTFITNPVAAGERKTMTTIVSKVKTAVNDNQVVVFNLMISCMSAERQIDLAKLGIDVDSLPSASRKLVQEKIFPKEFLNNYARLRDRANAVLDKGAAVRVELGVVSSRTEAVSKIADLNSIKEDWAKQIETDRTRYDQICNERISMIAAQAFQEDVPAEMVNLLVTALRKRQPVWEDFVNRMKFEYSAMPIQLELDENSVGFDPVLFQAQREGIVALREGVFGALVQYLTRESNDILKVLNGKRPIQGLYAVNYRTVTRIGEITDKLHGLSFVHKNVAPLAKVIDDALAFMPKSVEKDLQLPVAHFLNLLACLEAMADQHELLSRLREKQPLVEVTPLPQLQVAGGGAATAAAQVAPAAPATAVATPVVATAVAPAAQVVEVSGEAEAEEEAFVEAETEVECIVEAEAEPIAEEESLFDLPFLGSSLFA
jgi:hypothetical protein